jgi:hypothetical protein
VVCFFRIFPETPGRGVRCLATLHQLGRYPLGSDGDGRWALPACLFHPAHHALREVRIVPQPHRFYCGVDWDARTMYFCILDHAGRIVFYEEVPVEARPDSLPGEPNRPGRRGLTPPGSPLSKGRAVLLRHPQMVRDDILGREGKPSQSPIRKAQRQTFNSCLAQPACEVDARFLNESVAAVRRASSASSFTNNWGYSVWSGVRPLELLFGAPF